MPMPADLRKALRMEAGVGAWTVSGALYGTPAAGFHYAENPQKCIEGHREPLLFFSPSEDSQFGAMIARMLGNSALASRLKTKVQVGKALFEMNRGIPNGRFLAGAYWRRRAGLPSNFPRHADPAADNCGLLWLSPIIPMRGEDVLRLHAIIEPIFEQHRFDLFITFSMVNERALGTVITIAYDKEEIAETERAQACYRALFPICCGSWLYSLSRRYPIHGGP